MIQRLQTVFLFLASGSCFGLFGTDLADSQAPVAESTLFADGSYDVFDDPVLMGLFALAGIIYLIGIFLFGNRPLQARLSSGTAILVLCGVLYAIYRYVASTSGVVAPAVRPDIGVVLPVLALAFGLLAAKYIRADERLVRSADRLR